jgi:AcrR family transcriptional regulator
MHDSASHRILEAALEEFARRGYEAASTNAIAARAQVAKGLVFHHFASKEGLLEAVFQRAMERFKSVVFQAPLTSSSDLLRRLHQMTVRKLTVAQKHPLTHEFLSVALSEAPERLTPKFVAAQTSLMQEAWHVATQGVDATTLKEGLALADAVETISLLGEGLERQFSALFKNHSFSLEEISARTWKHFERLRDGLYRRDGGPQKGASSSPGGGTASGSGTPLSKL